MARFYGMNMLSELDHPEEYYINASERALYFMPPTASFSSPATADEEGASPLLGDVAAVLSINETVLNITGARWLRLSGLTIAHSTGNGVEANGAQVSVLPATSILYLLAAPTVRTLCPG